MAFSLRLSLVVLVAALACGHCMAQSSAAPSPAPAGPVNLTAILEKAGQYTTFMRLLASTQVGNQIANQVNTSTEGMTVFAPTDNAFQNLKAGTINNLSDQDQVKLVLNHVLPKFNSFDNFETISNPVRTQATGDDGEAFTLEIVSIGNRQVNVSSGKVTTQLNNALREKFPLAVYQVDKVLLPPALFEAKSPKSSPVGSATKSKSGDSKSDGKAAEGPATDSADAEAKDNGGYGLKSMGMGFVALVGIFTTGFLF
ncbi:fasciclin-like arabinogalactan protein 9 [Chenopodium quinoa]|uniref:FAS1 domain-containing protein n=1 Tax=Chenopodium quinoa TaxID=63459 RepID=A0A803NBI8_CHEQI|nr:fasciclin-like arabinogalactan protein 9 [Chenopodium quinoa]